MLVISIAIMPPMLQPPSRYGPLGNFWRMRETYCDARAERDVGRYVEYFLGEVIIGDEIP